MSRNGHISDNEMHADPGIEIHAHAGRRVRTERDMRTVFEKGAPGRRAFVCPELDVPRADGLLPERFRRAEGINPGYPLRRDYPEYDDALLVALTEQRDRGDVDRLADALGRAVAAERQPAEARA